MTTYATVDDVIRLGRTLTSEEEGKASALLESAAAVIRKRAAKYGKDFDEMLKDDEDLQSIAREVSVRVVLRVLNASTTMEAASQITETAGPYTQTFTPLIPGGGIFFRKSEWQMLGLAGQLVKNVELL